MFTAPALTLLLLAIVVGLGIALVWMLWEIEQMSKPRPTAIGQVRPQSCVATCPKSTDLTDVKKRVVRNGKRETTIFSWMRNWRARFQQVIHPRLLALPSNPAV